MPVAQTLPGGLATQQADRAAAQAARLARQQTRRQPRNPGGPITDPGVDPGTNPGTNPGTSPGTTPPTPPTPPAVTSTGSDPTTTTNVQTPPTQGDRFYDAPVDSVYDRFNRMVADDGKLMQMARGESTQAMNRRGLVNSSIAIGEGQDAAYRAALPLAQQESDATNQMYRMGQQQKWQTGEREASQTWQSGENKLTRDHQLNMQDLNQKWQTAEQKLNRALQWDMQTRSIESAAALQAAQQEFQQEMAAIQQGYTQANMAYQFQLTEELDSFRAGLAVDTQEQIATINHNLGVLGAGNQSALGIVANLNQQIAGILADPDMTPENKQSTIDALTTSANNSLIAIGAVSGVDIEGLLDFGD